MMKKEYLIERFRRTMMQEADEQNNSLLLAKLIKAGLIKETQMKAYLIQEEFPALQKEQGALKAYYELGERYGYHHKYVPEIVKGGKVA